MLGDGNHNPAVFLENLQNTGPTGKQYDLQQFRANQNGIMQAQMQQMQQNHTISINPNSIQKRVVQKKLYRSSNHIKYF